MNANGHRTGDTGHYPALWGQGLVSLRHPSHSVCIVLDCIVLHCTALYCIVLYCIGWEGYNNNNNNHFFTAAGGWKCSIFYICLVLSQGCRKGDPQTESVVGAMKQESLSMSCCPLKHMAVIILYQA